MEDRVPIWIVGVGPGDPSYVTGRAAGLISAAAAVAGFALPLETAAQWVQGDRVLMTYRSQEADLLGLVERAAKGERCVVCAQGDPTISAGELIARVEAVWPVVEVVPGISSVQVACAKAGLALEESLVITFHKRGDTTRDQQELLRVALADQRNLIVLPRPWDFMPTAIAQYLLDGGVPADRGASIYQRLTLPDESVTSLSLAELAKITAEFSDLSIVVLHRGADVS